MKQTRKEIQNAFLKLARIKPVDKITVREIVGECKINRNSFYYHFEDLIGLIESIVGDLFTTRYREAFAQNPKAALLLMANDLEENIDVCRNIYMSKERDFLEIRLHGLIHDNVLEYMEEERFPGYNLSEDDKQLITQFYEGELFGLFHQWMRCVGDVNFQKNISRLYDLRQGTLQRMLERASHT